MQKRWIDNKVSVVDYVGFLDRTNTSRDVCAFVRTTKGYGLLPA